MITNTIVYCLESDSCTDLIKRFTQARKESKTVEFCVDDNFLKAYSRLTEGGQAMVSSAIASTPFIGVKFGTTRRFWDIEYRTKNDKKRDAAFRHVCSVLGSIATITQATVRYSDAEAKAFAYAIQSLFQVKQLVFLGPEPSYFRARAMVAGLAAHPSLETIRLEVDSLHSFIPAMLPLLARIPKFQRFELKHSLLASAASTVRFRPLNAQAIAQLLQTSLPIRVAFESLSLTSDAVSRAIYTGVAAAKVHGVEFDRCLFWNPSLLAEALRRSGLKSLRFSKMYMDSRTMSQLYTNLAGKLVSMVRLEELYCSHSSMYTAPSAAVELDEALALVVRTAVSISSLKHLGIYSCSFPEVLREALADCVRHNGSLQDLHVEVKLRCPNGVYTLSSLVEAVKTNYSLHELSLKLEASIVGSVDTADVFDPDDKKTIDCFVSLNRDGRRYLTHEPANQTLGIQVLGKVKDDLDCLFFHVRENPIVVSSATDSGVILRQDS